MICRSAACKLAGKGALPRQGTISCLDTVASRRRLQTVHWTVCVPLWRGRGFESRHSVKNKKLFHQTVKELFVVGVTGFEPTASWSRTKRATNCATPRKEKPQQLGCCGVVGDERIELPRAESESAALPLCESPSGLCLGRLPSTLIYYSVPDGICQRLF